MDKIRVFVFGVDSDFWIYSKYNLKSRDNYILSIGNDMNRDYATLIKAVSKDMKVKIITNQHIDVQGKNIEILSCLSNKELRCLYQKAKLVVIPSKRVYSESSGLSTCLQALSCGTPVIISDSRPMRELFTDMENICFYEPENVNYLSEVINKIINDEVLLSSLSVKGRDIIDRSLNMKNMSDTLLRELN